MAASRVYIAVGGTWKTITWLWFFAAAAWFLVYFIYEVAATWERCTLSNGGNSTVSAEFKARVKRWCVVRRFLLAVLLGLALIWTMVAIEHDMRKK